MNLFKNKVGRPSNKILRHRRLFYASIVGLITLLTLTALTYYNTKKDIEESKMVLYSNDLKGGLLIKFPIVKYYDNVSGIKLKKGSELKISGNLSYGGKTTYYFKHKLYANGKEVSITNNKCTKFQSGKVASVTLRFNTDKTQLETIIYKDKDCTKKLIGYRSSNYRLIDDNKNESKTKTFKATFKKNGATKIGKSSLTCTTNTSSCTVVAPTITKSGYKILGWATSKNGEAKYKVGDKISLTKNKSFYAIIKKDSSGNTNSKGTIKFTTNEDKTLKNAYVYTIGVKATPSSTTITAKSSKPNIVRVYKEDGKWKLKANDEGKATITFTASNGDSISRTYTVIYEHPSVSRVKKGVASTKKINGINVYVEKGCSSSVTNKYIADIEKIPSYLSPAIKNIYLISNSTLNSLYPSAPKDTVGMSFGNLPNIDFTCSKYVAGGIAHEAGHAMDTYYKNSTGNGYLADSKEYTTLYNNNYKKILRTYSFSNTREFFADSYAVYFTKYISKNIKGSRYENVKYPKELENQMKKTIEQIKGYKW